MDIAALISWVATAAGGFYLLGTWISRGGHRPQETGASHLPVPVVFGHFALAALGLVVWIVYLVTDESALAWTAFILLVPVALLGFVMFARWIPVYRAGATRAAGAVPEGPAAEAVTDEAAPAERHFPLAVVLGHGLFAVITVILVLLTALGVGGS